jgi:5-carboxymethyl-2-hydroxymuconate isomerase
MIDGQDLMSGIVSVVSAAGEIEREKFKCRLMQRGEYLVGEGDRSDAFVHLVIGILAGRSPESKELIGSSAIEYLEDYFSRSAGELSLQITVEVREIERNLYFKAIPGGRQEES